MKGKDFIEKVNRLECCIDMFSVSLSVRDGSKLILTEAQQEEIRYYLSDYHNMLMENNVK